MMPNDGSGVERMLKNYEELIRRFAFGDMTADEFETDYLARFKADQNQVSGTEFDVLDGLFADVDDYVKDPNLRARVGGLSGEELRTRTRAAYALLFGGRN